MQNVAEKSRMHPPRLAIFATVHIYSRLFELVLAGPSQTRSILDIIHKTFVTLLLVSKTHIVHISID